MEREKFSLFLGLALLAVGIVILGFLLATVLALVGNAGDFLQEQIGNDQGRAPQAFFAWSANGTTATFTDLSSSGSAAITTRTWDFGDGQTSTARDPTHTYPQSGEYFVRLTVRDADGLEAVAAARVMVVMGSGNGGTPETMPQFNADFGTILLPSAIGVLVTGLFAIAYLVGGAFVKAGWNLIRPRPETIRVRLNPKMLEMGATAEVVSRSTTPAEPDVPGPPPPDA